MLTKREKRVMDRVFELCAGEGSCLCAPWDILQQFSARERPDEAQLEGILHDLQADGYFDVIRSERRGDPVYVITLRAGGYSYCRESLQVRRSIAFRVALATGGAVLSFLVGLLLRALFS